VGQDDGSSTTNTILWIAILVLITILLNQGNDGGVADARLEAPNAEDRLAKTLAQVERPMRVLNNLCVPELRALIHSLKGVEPDAAGPIEEEIFDRLDGSLGKLIADDFVEGEPEGVDLRKYRYVTSVARHQAETFHGISDIFRSWIGDCGNRLNREPGV
jgi:hypothetical protein